MTHLCVAIFVRDADQARRDIALAAERGADMVELRIDEVADPAIVRDLLKGAVVPCIVTCRPTWEGGGSELDEEERLRLLWQAGDAGGSYLDVELLSRKRSILREKLDSLPREQRPGLIVSFHDFAGRPDRLYNVLAEMNAAEADVNKMVWTARTIRDNIEAFELIRTKHRPTIVLCMGEAGLISRILSKKFGAFLTFASLETGTGTAPGQISVADMKSTYRWDAISPSTRIYGVVGQPVGHSMSPAIHNAAFSAVGFDGLYVPLLVEAGYESFKAFLELFLSVEGMDLSGLSITIPHKENALRYLREKSAEIDPLGAAIGAINTIIVDRSSGQPKLRGINTDYAAILDCITSALGIARQQLAGRKIAVIGAGGTGRTAVAAFAHCGADVTIFNRTQDRAEALAGEFTGRTGPVRASHLAAVRDFVASTRPILINTTPIGMYPNVGVSPLDDLAVEFTPDMLVFDTIYNPAKTKLLAAADAAGARTVSGMEMFLRQAVGQFEAWTGKPAPTDIMRTVIERRLGERP